MKTQYTISIYTENYIGLLNRVSIIFSRRHINIESITASATNMKGIHRYTIVVLEENEELIQKVTKYLEKQVDIFSAAYYKNDDIIFQGMALYKVKNHDSSLKNEIKNIIKRHHATVLYTTSHYIIIQKVGHKDDIQGLLLDLESYGVIEYTASGRVAIAKCLENPQEKYIKHNKTHNK